MTRTGDVNSGVQRNDQVWVLRVGPKRTPSSKRSELKEGSHWRPKGQRLVRHAQLARSFRHKASDREIDRSDEDYTSTSPDNSPLPRQPMWGRSRRRSLDSEQGIKGGSKMKYSASAQNLSASIKSFKLIGQPEGLRASHSAQSLPKLIYPASRTASESTDSTFSRSDISSSIRLSISSDEPQEPEIRSRSESEGEVTKDWKEALMDAIKEKSNQSVVVPEYIVRALCTLPSLSEPSSVVRPEE